MRSIRMELTARAGTSVPGARYGAAGWKDASGNFWLFGGYGLDSNINNPAGNMNDLWEFTTSGQWNYISGSETNADPRHRRRMELKASGPAPTSPVVGTLRRRRLMLWATFGSSAAMPSTSTATSDRLTTCGSTTQAQASGTLDSGPETIDQTGVYGTQGTGSKTTIPGGREGQFSWFDSAGNFWVFAGNGFDSNGAAGYLNDLWSFNGTQWTWVGGQNVIDQPASYGTEGIANAGQYYRFARVAGRLGRSVWKRLDLCRPAGRRWLSHRPLGVHRRGLDLDEWLTEHRPDRHLRNRRAVVVRQHAHSRQQAMAWSDASGNFWLFGGYGYASEPAQIDGLNDLWEYQP